MMPKGNFFHKVILLIFWLSIWEDVGGHPEQYDSSKSKISHSPTSGLFGPIEISPSVLPHYPVPVPEEPIFPPYPTIPTRYNPVLTGKCPANFTALSDIFDRTASDCPLSIALVLGNAMCCPQFSSLLHIFQGYYYYYNGGDQLVLPVSVSEHCFEDIVNILASRGANSTVPTICSFKSSILTGSSCPVKSVSSFEKVVNTTQLLEACTTVDQLKECCSPVCQSAISEAALQLSGQNLAIGGSKLSVTDALSDCKGVVFSWLARMLPLDSANSVLRVLSSCKVNKVCPLSFGNLSEVAKGCRNEAAPSPSCCTSLNAYIGQLNTHILLTNRQAIICATTLASMLQQAGVMTNVYDLCDVDLRDFSLQTRGNQGCLLQSMPVDVVFDNVTGYSFMCDFTDNTGAPWPLSSSMSSFSLCAEKSLPARPTKQNSGYAETWHAGIKLLVVLVSLLAITDALK